MTLQKPALTVSTLAMLAALALAVPDPAIAQTPSRAAGAAAPTVRAVEFSDRMPLAGGALILPLARAGDLEARAGRLDEPTRRAVQRALDSAGFGYGARQTLTLRGIGDWDRILIVGLGGSPADAQWSGAVAGRSLVSEPASVTVLSDGLPAETTAAFATGLGIGHYRSDLYQSGRRTAPTPGPVTVISDLADDARSGFTSQGAALVEAMTWARDIANEPANVIYPEAFVERARAAFAGVAGVRVEVLDVPAMQRLGMGALLGVGQGSERPPRLLVIHYQGTGAPGGGPITLVGKGITFDTGGISIKPAAGMGNMKMDMSGAAAVTASVLALARSGAPVNVVAISALAENMPDGRAIRPGDVLTAMNGKTIEIINTDAEGRLVLADALVWAERNLAPAAIVDVATLTGAVGGALGDDYAGLFSRHDDLADQLDAAGRATGERLWRLPLNTSHGNDMASTIADLKNTSEGGGGASTGAWFIGEFVSRDMPWAHLDIANMAYGGPNDWTPAGSSGFAVRLLDRFVRDWRPIARGPADGGG